MNALDKLVIQKRLDCDNNCSYQVRKKRYREQRQNLGELNRLAQTKHRPTVNVDAFIHHTVKEEVEKVEVTAESDASTQDDDWFELSKKRMFEGDSVGYIKRLKTAHAEEIEEERRRKYEEWEGLHEQFVRDVEAFNEAISNYRDRETLRESFKEFERMKMKEATDMDVDDEVLKQMEKEIEAMDISDDDDESAMDAFRDEYFDQQREDVGALEDLI